MAACRYLGFCFVGISSPCDAHLLALLCIWQNINILAQTVQKLWHSENPKWRAAVILDFGVARFLAIACRLRLPSCKI